jgi:hypothetical protein
MPQGSMLGPVFYLLYIADLSVALSSTIEIYVYSRTCTHNNHIETSLRLQESLYHIQSWLKNGESKLTKQNLYR